MKRRFFTVVAAVVSFLMVGTVVAQAANVTFGGLVRPRWELWEQRGFNTTSNASTFINVRARLNAKVEVDSKTHAFFQLQSNHRFGSGLATPANPTDHNPTSANSITNDVGFHQVYMLLKDFFGMPIDVLVGRKEVVLDGHRLFGNTIWTQGGQSHDLVMLTHKHGNHTIHAIYSKSVDNARQGPGAFNGTSLNDNNDFTNWIVFANFQGLVPGANSSTSLYFVYSDIDNGAAGNVTQTTAGGPPVADNDIWTIGVRQAGQVAGIDYRGEFYYQFGNSSLFAPAGSSGRSAYLIGIRVGKTFTSVMWSPNITLWWDYLSGSDAADRTAGANKTFNTLFDTGHKFYGLIDTYLNPAGANTAFLGLIDWAIKGSIKPMANLTLKAHWHLFQTAADLGDSANAGLAATIGAAAGPFGGSTGQTLGHELDLIAVYKYSANTTISAGYSRYFANELFYAVSGFDIGGGSADPNNQDADWAWVMFTVKF